MMLASFSDYAPVSDLAKIWAVCIFVGLVAPSAVTVAIVGVGRQAHAQQQRRTDAAGIALIAVGIAILAGLIAFGLYALFTD